MRGKEQGKHHLQQDLIRRQFRPPDLTNLPRSRRLPQYRLQQKRRIQHRFQRVAMRKAPRLPLNDDLRTITRDELRQHLQRKHPAMPLIAVLTGSERIARETRRQCQELRGWHGRGLIDQQNIRLRRAEERVIWREKKDVIHVRQQLLQTGEIAAKRRHHQ